MKTFYLTLACILVSLACNAQKVWNFSELDAQSLSRLTKLEGGLTIGGTSVKPCVVDLNKKSIDGFHFTKRLKFPGPGSANGRFLAVHVDGNCTLTVYGMAANNDDGDRWLTISKGGMRDTDIIRDGFLHSDGYKIGRDSFRYVGGPADLYIYCQRSGFNLYAVKVD